MRHTVLVFLAACGAAPVPAPVASTATPKPATEVIAAITANVHGRVEIDGAPVTYFGITYVKSFASGLSEQAPLAIHTADGTFAAAIPWGHWDLIIAAPGAARQVIAGVDVAAKLDLGTVSLRRGHTLTGVVRDETGQPVPDARVEFLAQPTFAELGELEALMRGNISTQTDSSGHYTIRGASRALLRPGHASLVATSTDRGSLPVDAPDADATIDLQITPTGTLDVRVTEGTALMATASVHGSGVVGKRIDGGWRFAHIPAGTYDVAVYDSRMQPRVHQSVTVQPGAAESLTLALPPLVPVEVAITSTQTTCSEIQLRDMYNAEVAIAPCTDKVATFPRLEPGMYIACVDKHACSPIRIEDTPAQQKIDVPRSDR